MTLCLTEIQAADGAHKIWPVWLHNKASKNAIVPTHFLDKAGMESFRVWLHTVSTKIKKALLGGTCASRGRLIGFKSDSAELANGFMIFNNVGTPLEGKLKCVLLGDVENEIGNHVTL